MLQGLVCRDAVEPCRQRPVAPVGVNAAQDLDASLLQHVLGIIMPDDDATDVPIQGVAVLLHEHSEALFALRRAHEHLLQ